MDAVKLPGFIVSSHLSTVDTSDRKAALRAWREDVYFMAGERLRAANQETRKGLSARSRIFQPPRAILPATWLPTGTSASIAACKAPGKSTGSSCRKPD